MENARSIKQRKPVYADLVVYVACSVGILQGVQSLNEVAVGWRNARNHHCVAIIHNTHPPGHHVISCHGLAIYLDALRSVTGLYLLIGQVKYHVAYITACKFKFGLNPVCL